MDSPVAQYDVELYNACATRGMLKRHALVLAWVRGSEPWGIPNDRPQCGPWSYIARRDWMRLLDTTEEHVRHSKRKLIEWGFLRQFVYRQGAVAAGYACLNYELLGRYLTDYRQFPNLIQKVLVNELHPDPAPMSLFTPLPPRADLAESVVAEQMRCQAATDAVDTSSDE